MGVILDKNKKTGRLKCDAEGCTSESEKYKASSPAAPDLTICEAAEHDGWKYDIGFWAMLRGHTVICPSCAARGVQLVPISNENGPVYAPESVPSEEARPPVESRDDWSHDVVRSYTGKNYLLRFLPYLETPDGRSADVTIGYTTRRRGYIEEFYASEAQMLERAEFLRSVLAIELYEFCRRNEPNGRHWTMYDQGPAKDEPAEEPRA